MTLTTTKEESLSCRTNKAHSVNVLSDCLRGKGLRTIQAKADADLRTVVECLKTLYIVVIADDNDLLVLLLNHCIPEHHKVYLHSGPTPTTSGATWDMEAILKKIWTETCKLLPFTHAITGCETTARLHGLGKGFALKRLRDKEQARENASTFSQTDASKNWTKVAGEALLSILYGGKSPDNLDGYRHRVFQQKVATSTIFGPFSRSTFYFSSSEISMFLNISSSTRLDWALEPCP